MEYVYNYPARYNLIYACIRITMLLLNYSNKTYIIILSIMSWPVVFKPDMNSRAHEMHFVYTIIVQCIYGGDRQR